MVDWWYGGGRSEMEEEMKKKRRGFRCRCAVLVRSHAPRLVGADSGHKSQRNFVAGRIGPYFAHQAQNDGSVSAAHCDVQHRSGKKMVLMFLEYQFKACTSSM